MDKTEELQPCGHPRACIVKGPPWGAGGSYVHYCGWCASLEHLEHSRRLWKCSAKQHREQHLALQEICHSQAEMLIDRYSQVRKLQEDLATCGDNVQAVAAEQRRAWKVVIETRSILRDIRKHCSCDPDDPDAWQAWTAMDDALKEEPETP